MKRIWLWLALLAAATALGLFSTHGTDAAVLRPARLLMVDASGGTLRLETDQGDIGLGSTLDAAMADLHAGAPGTAFLDTAQHVIVSRRAGYLIPQLVVSRALRPAAKLYLAPALPDRSNLVDFLTAHPGNLTLQSARIAFLYGDTPAPPLLIETEGGLRLVG